MPNEEFANDTTTPTSFANNMKLRRAIKMLSKCYQPEAHRLPSEVNRYSLKPTIVVTDYRRDYGWHGVKTQSVKNGVNKGIARSRCARRRLNEDQYRKNERVKQRKREREKIQDKQSSSSFKLHAMFPETTKERK